MTRTDIPDDLVAAMRAAAGAAPPHSGDLAAVRRRGRARRRRRAAAVAGVAAVAVAAAVAVPSVIAGPAAPSADGSRVAVSRPAAPAEPAQRLLINGAVWELVSSEDGTELRGAESGETAREAYERLRAWPGAVGVISGWAELRPDGEVVELDLDLPGIDSISDVAAMPDGRLAAIGVVDRMPEVERDDGPCVEGVDFPLLVIEADGSVSRSREVRVMCETVRLLAADADTAYLARDSRLVAHDLATGEERTLVEAPHPLDGGYGSVAPGRVATAAAEPRDDPCPPDEVGEQIVVRVVEFGSGASSSYPLRPRGCSGYAGAMRLSPDGRYAAVAFYRLLDDGRYFDLGVAILDLDTGDVVRDQTIVEGYQDRQDVTVDIGNGSITSTRGAISGIAWDDERTLRVAWYEVPDEGVHWISDVIQVSTISVP
jgi:hypothetical protein